ncbi:MAG: hypothetical protein ACE5HI_05650, partial [bacterium]
AYRANVAQRDYRNKTRNRGRLFSENSQMMGYAGLGAILSHKCLNFRQGLPVRKTSSDGWDIDLDRYDFD